MFSWINQIGLQQYNLGLVERFPDLQHLQIPWDYGVKGSYYHLWLVIATVIVLVALPKQGSYCHLQLVITTTTIVVSCSAKILLLPLTDYNHNSGGVLQFGGPKKDSARS